MCYAHLLPGPKGLPDVSLRNVISLATLGAAQFPRRPGTRHAILRRLRAYVIITVTVLGDCVQVIAGGETVAGTLPRHLSIRLGDRESLEPEKAAKKSKPKKEKKEKKHKHKKDRKRHKHDDGRGRSPNAELRAESLSPKRSFSPIPRRPAVRQASPARQPSPSPDHPKAEVLRVASPKGKANVSQVPLSVILLCHCRFVLRRLHTAFSGTYCIQRPVIEKPNLFFHTTCQLNQHFTQQSLIPCSMLQCHRIHIPPP